MTDAPSSENSSAPYNPTSVPQPPAEPPCSVKSTEVKNRDATEHPHDENSSRFEQWLHKWFRKEYFMAILTAGLLVAAVSQWWITRDTARRQLRAYVGFQSATVEDTKEPGKSNGRIAMVLKNFGQTPARNVRAEIMVCFVPKAPNANMAKLPDDFAYALPAPSEEARKTMLWGYDYLEPSRDRPSYSDQLKTVQFFTTDFIKNNSIYIYGKIAYTDIYDFNHVRDYCFLYVPDNPPDFRLVTADAHNDEREAKK